MELEHALLKCPYELLAKELRYSQKLLDKELQQTSKTVQDLALKAGSLSNDKIYSTLDGLVVRLKGLKRKLEESKQKEEEQVRKAKHRLQHLGQIQADASAPHSPSRHLGRGSFGAMDGSPFRQLRMERMLVDHLLRNGYFASARGIIEARGLQDLCDLEVYERGRVVIEGLKNRDCTEALKWCFENRYKLRKTKSSLELNLRLQEFIELVRQDKPKEAILYARKHFAVASGNDVSRIQRAMGALAFRRDTDCPQYKPLFESQRWDDLIEEFKSDCSAVHSLPQEPTFIVLLGCGMASLKTPQCYEAENTSGAKPLSTRISASGRVGLKYFNLSSRLRRGSEPVSEADVEASSTATPASSSSSSVSVPAREHDSCVRKCPICTPKFRELARSLPFSHRVNSSLICSITGRVMDEDNFPYVLPNGNVYSKAAVEEIMAKNDGKVVCPKTGFVYKLPQLSKAFIS